MDETTTLSTTELETTTDAALLEEGDTVTVEYETTRGNDAEIHGEVTEVRALGHGYGDAFVTDADTGREYLLFGAGEGNLEVKSLLSGAGHTVGRRATVTVEADVATDGGETETETETETRVNAVTATPNGGEIRLVYDGADDTERVEISRDDATVVLSSHPSGSLRATQVYNQVIAPFVDDEGRERHGPEAVDRGEGIETDGGRDVEAEIRDAVNPEGWFDGFVESVEISSTGDATVVTEPYPAEIELMQAADRINAVEGLAVRRTRPGEANRAEFVVRVEDPAPAADDVDRGRGVETDGGRDEYLGEEIRVCHKKGRVRRYVDEAAYEVSIELGGVHQDITVTEEFVADQLDDPVAMTDGGQDPHDLPGHGRVGGIDDPVGRHEYGDDPDAVREAELDAVDPGRTPRLSASEIRSFVEANVAGRDGVLEVNAKPLPEGWDWTVVLPVVEDLAPLADLGLEVASIGAKSDAWRGEYAAVVLDLKELEESSD